jgi:two-component system, OmpR family, response regulator RpaA
MVCNETCAGMEIMAHILIVDDSIAFVLAISESLRFRGYRVTSAFDGVEALRHADMNAPDLVLLDIEMPGIDGFRFCQELRSNPRFHSIPVIFMSVRSDLADKLAAYEVGADDYLVKPFDMLELSARLQAVLRRSARQTAVDRERDLQLHAQPSQAVQADRGAKTADAPGAGAHRIMEVPGLRLNLDNALVQSELGEARLTPAEFELLKYMLVHPDQILASERLLQEVWLYPAGVGDPAVVRWHVKNLRRKIEAEPEKPVRLRTISHHGYILLSQPKAL